MNIINKIISDQLKFLTFRPIKLDPSAIKYYLIFALGFTWLCGMGRYWDNPRAEWWQYLGLGSVIYVFTLALILWLIMLPLKPARWRYQTVLLFVAMTSPPAILYAIPVERFMSLHAAQLANVWFLAVVAIWRVALLFRYLYSVAGLSVPAVIVASLLPLTLIVSALTALNLEHVVFRIMAGITPAEQSGNDMAYGVLFMITFFSVLAFPVLLMGYLVLVYQRWSDKD